MWVVRDADSTMYLFGTVHFLPPKTEWRTPRFDQALKDSQEVWFEVDTDAFDQQKLAELMKHVGFDRERPLSAHLTAEESEQLAAAVAAIGAQMAEFEPMRPWLASLILLARQISHGGYQAGIELKLTSELKGKTIRGLETLNEQFEFFAGMSETTQHAFLMDIVKRRDEVKSGIQDVVQAWARGDREALETVVTLHSAELHDILIRKRNVAWLETLIAELAGSGVDFVAVGAAHLFGPDGLPALLTAKGYQVVLLSEVPGAQKP